MSIISADDYHPFDIATLTRVRDENGEPTERVEIEGLRQGGMRTRVVTYTRLLEQADLHREIAHGTTSADPQSAREFAHATIRGAVAFLVD
jgi:hypothetical protein